MKNQQPKEEWRDIQDFEGFYQVSNLGRVKSLKRGRKKERIRVFATAPNGYLRMVLSAKNFRRTISGHRVVAAAFIPNPSNYGTINHKNFDKTDNCVSNLEWASIQQNIKHACDNGQRFRKAIQQLDLSNRVIKEWESAYRVQLELSYFATNISRCCRNKQKTYKNFKWRYSNATN